MQSNLKFQLKTDYIELFKLLKVMNLCNSGAEAKICIEDELVSVDGEIELRKRRKLTSGCVVDFEGHQIVVE